MMVTGASSLDGCGLFPWNGGRGRVVKGDDMGKTHFL